MADMYGSELIQVLDMLAQGGFMIPPIEIKADHSCNWKCCLWCCPQKKEPVTPPASLNSQDSTHVVETTAKVTQVYTHHHRKESK